MHSFENRTMHLVVSHLNCREKALGYEETLPTVFQTAYTWKNWKSKVYVCCIINYFVERFHSSYSCRQKEVCILFSHPKSHFIQGRREKIRSRRENIQNNKTVQFFSGPPWKLQFCARRPKTRSDNLKKDLAMKNPGPEGSPSPEENPPFIRPDFIQFAKVTFCNSFPE